MIPSPNAGRHLFRTASIFAFLCALAHALGHIFFYIDIGSFDSRRRAVYETMTSYEADPVLHGSLWRILQMFSLSFSLFLLLTGVVGFWLLKQDVPPAVLRSLTRLFVVFWLLALGLFCGLHPVIQPITISAALALLYGLSLWLQRRVV